MSNRRRHQGNLDERVTDAIIWELMLQAGPVGTSPHNRAKSIKRLVYHLLVNVHLPKDRVSMAHQGYGFCEFLTEEDAEYACKIMNQIKLWGKPIRVNKVRHHIGLRTGILTRRRGCRLRLIKNNWMLVRTSSLEIWMKTWTSGFCMTRLVHLGSWLQRPRCVI